MRPPPARQNTIAPPRRGTPVLLMAMSLTAGLIAVAPVATAAGPGVPLSGQPAAVTGGPVDRTRPDRAPAVTSAQFPENDGDNGSPVRTEGTFTLSANGVPDVTAYQWWTTTDHQVREATPAQPGGSVDIVHRPFEAGPQTLYVRSLDAAGNRSDLKEYLFYAKRTPARDKPGDLNGDGTVDLWSVDPVTGTLRMHPGKGDGTFGPSAQLGHGSFADATSLTHRGSWDEDHYEDLIVLRPSPDGSRKNLYVHPNRGDGDLRNADAHRVELQVTTPEADHWAQADQVLSIPSVDDDDGNGTTDEADQADLLVKTGDELWLYLGSTMGFLDVISEPVRLGNADWKDMTLMAPGDLNGDRLPELWARSTATGEIHQYTSRPATAPGSVTTADLTVYADPAVRASAIATGFPGASLPHLSSNGDFEADGHADLWSRDGDGRITGFPGRAPADGSVFGPGRPLVPGGTL